MPKHPADLAQLSGLPDPQSNEHALRGREIICVGLADWDAELPTSQHHLMSRLAHRNRILFVESLGVRRPQLSAQDAKRLARRARSGLSGLRRSGEVHVLSPVTLPYHSARATRAINARLLCAQVQAAVDRLRMRSPILWSYSPYAAPLVKSLDPAMVLYHCVDDLAAHKGVDGPSFRTAERRYLELSDLVLASAPAIASRLSETANGRVEEAWNVADVRFFASAADPGPVDSAMQALRGPRIVFTGTVVATKLDVDFMVELARARPSWSFPLVGPIGLGDPSTDVSALEREPNIHLLGPRPYQKLPDVLRGADAAIIPYAINPLTRSVFPMKVYEYLGAGLPVVSTHLPALRGVEGLSLVTTVERAVSELERLMGEDKKVQRARQMTAAAGHSWEARLDQIAAAVEAIDLRRVPQMIQSPVTSS